MPASSKQQQKFMGIVHAIQKGDIPASDVSPEAQKVAQDMKPSDVKDFASTSHKGLPKKVKQEILNRLKEYAGKMGRDHMGGDDIPSAKKGGLRDFDGYDNVDYNRDMPQDEGNLPTNWLQGRVSDYHTKKGTTPREDYEDTNFNKDNSGQPDLEEGDLEDAIHQVKKFDKPKDGKLLTIKVINKLKDKRNKSNSSDNKEKLQKMIDKIEGDYKKGKFLTEASFHALNNPRMKKSLSNLVKDKKVENPETGRQVSVQTAVSNPEHPAHDKAVQIKKSLLQRLKGMLKNEYGSVSTDNFLLPSEKDKLDGTPEDKDAINTTLDETMIRRAVDLAQEILPKDTWARYASDGKKNKEFVKSVVRDLAQLLNRFYKSHDVDVRIKEEVLKEVLAGRIGQYTGSSPMRLVPARIYTIKNEKDKEKTQAIEKDLAYHLNTFWKQWNFPYRIDLSKKHY